MDWKEIVIEKNLHYHRLSSLVILMITVMITMILVVIPFFNSYIPQDYQPFSKIILLLLAESILIVHWYFYRLIFPKGKKGIQNIVVAIVTENQKQKDRITKDFVLDLKKQLKDYQLNKIYDILILHNAQSIHLRRIIDEAFVNTKNKKSNITELKRFNNINNRMNAKFIVFGNLISRDSPHDRYILNIEALIRHRKAPIPQQGEMSDEFKQIWEREICFLEENESTGFKSTSKQIFFAATYMLGLATIVDLNYAKGIEIGTKLLDYVKNNEKYTEFEPKVIKLLMLSYFMFSRVLHYLGDFENSTYYRRKYHELVSDDYDNYLNEAIFQVNKRNDPQTALELVDKARKVAKGNGTWKYSKFYLLIKLNRHKDALRMLDNIISTKYKNEFDTINQVISYNFHCFNEDPYHIQSLFIIGVLIYKKLNNAPVAYDKLEEFINKTDGDENWQFLHKRAKLYLDEINNTMEISDN